MILSADTINGILLIPSNKDSSFDEAVAIINLKPNILNEIDFYESLSTLKESDPIIMCKASLSMTKKIHKEYGITIY